MSFPEAHKPDWLVGSFLVWLSMSGLKVTKLKIVFTFLIMIGFLCEGCSMEPQGQHLQVPSTAIRTLTLVPTSTKYPIQTPLPSSPATKLPSSSSTPTITAAAYLQRVTSTPTPLPWYSRSSFPEIDYKYAYVQKPLEVLMYDSLEAASSSSQAYYRFAFDLVYVSIIEIQAVGGVDYARIIYNGHERWLRAEALLEVEISPFAGIVIEHVPESQSDLDSLGMVITDTISENGISYHRGDVILPVRVDEQTNVVFFSGTDRLDPDKFALVPFFLELDDDRYSCRRIVVDISSHILSVYDENCVLTFVTLISTGILPGSTPTGIYRIATKEDRHTFRVPPELRETLGSYIFEDVPFTMVFSGYYALHSVYWHNSFGSNTSHGCINLSLSDASWLFNWAQAGEWLFIQY